MADLPIPTRWAIYEESNLWIPKINPALATEIGLEQSLVFTQMVFLLKLSNYVHDGRYWVYKTASELRKESFPFFSRPIITRTLQDITEVRHLLDRRDDLNTRKGDRTYWYALNVEYVSRLTSIALLPANQTNVQNEQALVQNEQALPDITTDINTFSPVGGTRIPASKLNPMKDAIAQAFGWPTPTKAEWGRIQATAKQLVDAGVAVEELPDLYRWCKAQGWSSFTPLALAGRVSDWRKSQAGNGGDDDLPINNFDKMLEHLGL